MTFGKKLQSLRKEHNISQEKLAEAINVSRQAVSKWEQDLVVPDTENLLLVSKYFDVSLEELLGTQTKTTSPKYIGKPYSESRHNTNSVKRSSKIFIILGVLLIALSICFTYILKYYDFLLNGSCYTNPIHYVFEFPLVLVLIIGAGSLVAGIVRIAKDQYNKNKEYTGD